MEDENEGLKSVILVGEEAEFKDSNVRTRSL